jgi:hypothetical protein
MKIKLLKSTRIKGRHAARGETVDTDAQIARALIAAGIAEAAPAPEPEPAAPKKKRAPRKPPADPPEETTDPGE